MKDIYTEDEASTIVDLDEEFAATISQMMCGDEPETVTHVMLADRQPMTREHIAARLGRRTFEIEGTLAALESRGWAIRFSELDHEKYLLTTPLRSGQSAS